MRLRMSFLNLGLTLPLFLVQDLTLLIKFRLLWFENIGAVVQAYASYIFFILMFNIVIAPWKPKSYLKSGLQDEIIL